MEALQRHQKGNVALELPKRLLLVRVVAGRRRDATSAEAPRGGGRGGRAAAHPSCRDNLCSSGRRRGGSAIVPRRANVPPWSPRGSTVDDNACRGRATSAEAVRHRGEAVAPRHHRPVLLGLWHRRGGPTSAADRQGGVRTRDRGRDGVRGPRRSDRGEAGAAGRHPLVLLGGHGASLTLCKHPASWAKNTRFL